MPDAIWNSLATFGIGGIVLGWFMFKSEPRLRAIEAAIDRISRSILLLSVAISKLIKEPIIKAEADGISREIDQAEKVRETKK